MAQTRCQALTTKGTRCKRTSLPGSDQCKAHKDQRRQAIDGQPGTDIIRQHHHEDQAWGMILRGANFSQVARTLVDDDGTQIYANATSVRRASERAHIRHGNPKESQYHRDKQDSILNTQLAGHLREMGTIEDMATRIEEIRLLAGVTDEPDERMRLHAQAENMEESRHTRRLQVSIEIRRVVESLGRVWGTTTHRQEPEVSVLQSAPVDMLRLTPDERRMVLKAVSEDALRRAHAIPAVTTDG